MNADSLPIRCPECRLLSPPTALACDCGHRFGSGRVEGRGPAASHGTAGQPRGARARSILAAASLVAMTSGGLLLAVFRDIHTQGGPILAGVALSGVGAVGALAWSAWVVVGGLDRLRRRVRGV